jgi:hypothetical protein
MSFPHRTFVSGCCFLIAMNTYALCLEVGNLNKKMNEWEVSIPTMLKENKILKRKLHWFSGSVNQNEE